MEVICKGQTPGKAVLAEVSDGEKRETVTLRGVRVGLSWPMAQSPGFYVLVGQSFQKGVTGRFSLRVLKEGSFSIPNDLFVTMADDSGAWWAEEIYSDISEPFRDYVLHWATFKKAERPRQRLFLKSAPFYQDFSHGVYVIRRWTKENGLIIPKDSVIYNQLKKITGDDLRQDPEGRFFAVNGLRFVMGSFEVSDIYPKKDPQYATPPPGAFT